MPPRSARWRFAPWRTSDELRAGLTSGQIALSVVPVQAAANLYNRGFPIRLAHLMTNGLLYIISAAPDIKGFPDLARRKVAVPFRDDTPEIILSQLLAHHGIDAQAGLQSTDTATPIEAMQLLLAGAGLMLAGAARLGAFWPEVAGLHIAFMGGLGVCAVFCIGGVMHSGRPLGLSLPVRPGAICLALSIGLRVAPDFGFDIPGPLHLVNLRIIAAK
jgi:hypothetical protein